MPKVKVNPNAKPPSRIAVIAGEYRMKFGRVDEWQSKACRQGEKSGKYYTQMVLEHLAAPTDLINLEGNQPLKPNENPGKVFVTFMMDEDMQGTLRQAVEAAGFEWPQDPNLEIDEFWIQDTLDGKEVQVRLKTAQYKGDWKNEVQRFLVPSA